MNVKKTPTFVVWAQARYAKTVKELSSVSATQAMGMVAVGNVKVGTEITFLIIPMVRSKYSQ